MNQLLKINPQLPSQFLSLSNSPHTQVHTHTYMHTHPVGSVFARQPYLINQYNLELPTLRNTCFIRINSGRKDKITLSAKKCIILFYNYLKLYVCAYAHVVCTPACICDQMIKKQWAKFLIVSVYGQWNYSNFCALFYVSKIPKFTYMTSIAPPQN